MVPPKTNRRLLEDRSPGESKRRRSFQVSSVQLEGCRKVASNQHLPLDIKSGEPPILRSSHFHESYHLYFESSSLIRFFFPNMNNRTELLDQQKSISSETLLKSLEVDEVLWSSSRELATLDRFQSRSPLLTIRFDSDCGADGPLISTQLLLGR